MHANAPGAPNEGATVVITHRVREGSQPAYERWLGQIAPLCRAAPGHLDWHIVRPIPGLSETYTAIIRFDTPEHLRDWMASPARNDLVHGVRDLLVGGDDFVVSHGLDFWFASASAPGKVPVRWKQCLVTWSAIYPLVLVVPWALTHFFLVLGLHVHHALATLAATGVIVFLMVYVVMPRYTRRLRRWLIS